MKRNILLMTLAAGLLLTTTSCEDGKDEYLSDFSTIMYFRNSGELPVDIKSGIDTEYDLIINKSGSQLGSTASLDVDVMSEESLAVYNEANSVNYKILPKECYSFEGGKVEFSSSELYKKVKVLLKAGPIEENLGNEATYVIPFELYNGTDSINSKKSNAFIIPSVVTEY